MSDLATLLGEKVFINSNVYQPSGNYIAAKAFRISLKYPHCCKEGIFDPIDNVQDAIFPRTYKYDGPLNDALQSGAEMFAIGVRSCPNAKCRGAVTIVAEITPHSETLVTYSPRALIDFRSDNIPMMIAESLKEAVAANGAQAYRASTLMVRRALELLCQEKGAKGANLKERIGKLTNFVTLSPSLLEAADELRILGNDAAHVEAHEYDDITKEHSDAAIELAKKILEAVYQHDDLVARLRNLKKPTVAKHQQ